MIPQRDTHRTGYSHRHPVPTGGCRGDGETTGPACGSGAGRGGAGRGGGSAGNEVQTPSREPPYNPKYCYEGANGRPPTSGESPPGIISTLSCSHPTRMGKQVEQLWGSSSVLHPHPHPHTASSGGWFVWVSGESPGQARGDGKLGQGGLPPWGRPPSASPDRAERQEVRALFLSSLLPERCVRPGPGLCAVSAAREENPFLYFIMGLFTRSEAHALSRSALRVLTHADSHVTTVRLLTPSAPVSPHQSPQHPWHFRGPQFGPGRGPRQRVACRAAWLAQGSPVLPQPFRAKCCPRRHGRGLLVHLAVEGHLAASGFHSARFQKTVSQPRTGFTATRSATEPLAHGRLCADIWAT